LAFLAAALPAMAALYMALYFPYAKGSIPERALTRYVTGVAAVAGAALHFFDARVAVTANTITGPFPLTVILDCTALDAQMLLAAAMFAFTASWSQKLLGLAVGLASLTALNLVRIGVLFFVGLNFPDRFHLVHEELCQFVIVGAAFAFFAGWIHWVGGAAARPSHGNPSNTYA
jgi:exosortase/archaeosortase family protein